MADDIAQWLEGLGLGQHAQAAGPQTPVSLRCEPFRGKLIGLEGPTWEIPVETEGGSG